MRFVTGFQVIDVLEESGIWALVEMPLETSEAELLAHAQGVIAREEQKPLSEDAAYFWESLLAEKAKGVAAAPVSIDTMDEIHGNGAVVGVAVFLCHTGDGGEAPYRQRQGNLDQCGYSLHGEVRHELCVYAGHCRRCVGDGGR